MKLFCSLTSPYVRKIRVAIRELELVEQVEEIVVDPWSDPAQLHAKNLLGKVPALLTDDGSTQPDSHLNLAYLFDLQREPCESSVTVDWNSARRAQLADGVIDAAVEMVVETKKRPSEYRWQGWLDRQQASIARTLDALEIEAAALQENEAGCTEINLACGLAYLDNRFLNVDRRDHRPDVMRWYSAFSRRASMLGIQPSA